MVQFLQQGRLIKIKTPEAEYDWGAVVNFKKVSEIIPGSKNKGQSKTQTRIKIDLLLHVISSENEGGDSIPKPCPEGQKGEVEIVSVDAVLITHISAVRIFCPDDLRTKNSRKSMYKAIEKVKEQFPDSVPLLSPIKDMKIKDPEFLDVVSKIEKLEKRMYEHPIHKSPLLETEYPKYQRKVVCKKELQVAKKKLTDARSILQLEELKCRKRVLRRLNYCTDADVIQLKGRVACELSCSDELLITEMIFNGVFGKLSPAQACALLSCLVFDEKSQKMPKLSEELSGPLRQMQELARRISKISNEARLPMDEDVYVERFKPFLMDIVFSWCNGASFKDLCMMTDVFEGSIVRSMRRLEELLRQMVQASKTIGNKDLEEKFNEGIKLIKRDVVFSASLYL